MRTAAYDIPTAATDQVERIVGLSRAAEVCAVNGDWREVARIHSRRRAIIDAYFAGPEERPRLNDADALREVLAIDRRVVELATAQRQKLGDRAGAMAHGRNAVLEYRRQSRSG